jgi:hypothetical protein
VYAIRSDYGEVRREASAAIDYLDGAYRCGHPLAAGWVREREPIRIMWWTEAEADTWLENEGVPILDREPVMA